MIRPNDAGLLLGKHAIEERSMGAWALGMMARREKVAFSKRVWDALEFGDIERLRKAVNGMVKGYEALEKWAEDNEVSPSPNIRFVEWKAQNGQIMAVTETINDCIDLQKLRKDLTIWTLEEFEVIINEPAVQFIIKAKAFDPTAQVKRFKAGDDFGKGSGFDDMVDDLEPIYSGGDPPKMFNLPKRK